jgi:hypothetical protein
MNALNLGNLSHMLYLSNPGEKKFRKPDPYSYYLVILFSYSVLNDKKNLRNLLKAENGILIKNYSAMVLQLLTETLLSHFHEELIFNELEGLLHLDEFKLLARIYKKKKE